MAGKTVLITGGNAGIGKATALALAKAGKEVIITCRSDEKGEKAITALKKASGNTHLSYLVGDLSSFASIQQLVQDFKKRHDHLDVLINNAGLFTDQLQKTEEGFELQFGVNHLGHFLLTKLLLGRLKAAFAPRVINVSSTAHYNGRIDFSSFRGEKKPYNGFHAYAQSKLANVLFTRSFAHRYPGIDCNCLHPGVVRTAIGTKNSKGIMAIMWFLWKPFMCSTSTGAETSVFLASSPKVKGTSGYYFDKKKKCPPSALAKDDKLADRLWEVSDGIIDEWVSG